MVKKIRYTFPKYSKDYGMWVVESYDRNDVYINFKLFKDFNLAYEFYEKVNSKI